MKHRSLAAWACAGLWALLAPTMAGAQINTCDHLFPDPDNPDRTLQEIIDAAAEGDIVCLRGAVNAAGTPTPNATVFYEAGLDISKSITLRGGWRQDNVDFLPNRIVLRARDANPACAGNLLRDASFEQHIAGNVNNAWTVAGAPNNAGIAQVLPYTAPQIDALNPKPFPNDSSNTAVFIQKNPGAAYTVRLTQDVTDLPEAPLNLRFDLAVYTASLNLPPEAIVFSAQVDGVAAPVNVLNPIFVQQGISEMNLQVAPVPQSGTVVAGAPRRLSLQIAINWPEATTLVVDNFCLQPAGVTPPVGVAAPALRLERPTADDAIAVRLENLSLLAPSGTGALVGDGVTVELNRCFVYGSAEGVKTLAGAADARVVAISSVFYQNSDAIYIQGGSATVFQCTFRDNPTAIRAEGLAAGPRDFVACLFAGNGGAVNAVGGLAAQVRMGGNAIFNSAGAPDFGTPTGVVSVGGVAAVVNTGVTDPGDDLYLDTPWIGKLKDDADSPQLFAGFGFADLPQPVQAALNNRIIQFDFELDPRNLGQLQVGADETRPTAGAGWFWQDVRFEYADGTQPNRGLNGNLPAAIGRNRPLAITVTLIGREAEDIAVFIVPELLLFEPATGNPVADPAAVVLEHGIPWGAGAKGFKAVDLFEATFTDVFTATYRDTPGGVNGLVDGLAAIVLVDDDGNIYGAGFNLDNVNPGVPGRAQFIVDTTPPVIGAPLSTGRDLVVASNDVLGAPPVYGPYPAQWPGVADLPASFGTINDRYRDPQVFFNLQTEPLTFTVALPFRDDGPLTADGSGLWTVATAGFDAYTLPAADATDVLFGGVDAEGALATLEDGQARWFGPRPGDTLLGALAEAALIDTGGGFEAVWTVGNVTYQVPANTWRLEGRFVARDRAGNEVVSARPLRLWWQTDARARITSAPSGPLSAPTVAWDLARATGPRDSQPAIPIARFRLWKERFPGAPNSPWDAVDTWSPWTDRAVIDQNSLSGNARLREILRDPALQGATMGISVVAADEAGNVQNPGVFDQPEFSAAELVVALANGAAWAQWENAEGPAPLDTRVQARFWHNRSVFDTCLPINDTAVLEAIRPDLGDIDFGASTRIPLPDKERAAFFRVEARFEISVNDPNAFVEWVLYEDGIFVGSGQLIPLTREPFFVQIPQDIVQPIGAGWQPAPGVSFLNGACPGSCAPTFDRLGDEGCDNDQGGQFRRRDVTYTFVARATDGVRNDPTPATVSFTVYVDDDATDDQPIKEVSRGN